MRYAGIALVMALLTGCHGYPGTPSRTPKVLELGKRYILVFQHSNAVWDVRIEDIDHEAGWVRVRRVDNFATWWINTAAVERIN